MKKDRNFGLLSKTTRNRNKREFTLESKTKTRDTNFRKQMSGKKHRILHPSTAYRNNFHAFVNITEDIKINEHRGEGGMYTSEYNIYIVRSRGMNISSR